jgi:hypothetical protein
MKEQARLKKIIQSLKELQNDLADYNVLLGTIAVFSILLLIELASSNTEESQEFLDESTNLLEKSFARATDLEMHSMMYYQRYSLKLKGLKRLTYLLAF